MPTVLEKFKETINKSGHSTKLGNPFQKQEFKDYLPKNTVFKDKR
jgi:hypothetical protein